MPKLRPLTNKQLIKILHTLGFQRNSQKGSHIKFVRFDTKKQIIIIPNHKQLAAGTTKEIFNQLCSFVPTENVKSLFYK